jgi:AcrR family transcriptional regulator
MGIDETSDRIVLSALAVFLKQGVRRSSLTDVAFEAGITRITVYRYFGDKRGLVEAVCRHVGGVFQRAAAGRPDDTAAQIDVRLKQMGEDLGRLRPGNWLACFEEIRRLYPTVYEEFRAAREAALDRIFEQAVAAASREQTLREGINLLVVKAMFWASVVGLIDNPTLIAANIPIAEICETVTAVLRHGMLKYGDDHEVAQQTIARGVEHVEP